MGYNRISLVMLCSLSPITLHAGMNSFWPLKKTESFSKDYATTATPTITITLDSGSVTVDSWEQNTVALRVKKQGSEESIKNTKIIVKPDQTGNTIAFSTHTPSEEAGARTDFFITVPEKTEALTITTNKGSIDIEDVAGALTVSTQLGNIAIKNAHKKINAASMNGTISIKNARGFIEAHAHKGSIDIRQKTLLPETSMLLDVLTGNVTIALPRNAQALLAAQTGTGTVTSEHAITLDQKTMKLNKDTWNECKKEAHGTLGKNEKKATITVDVTTGNIHFLVTQGGE